MLGRVRRCPVSLRWRPHTLTQRPALQSFLSIIIRDDASPSPRNQFQTRAFHKSFDVAQSTAAAVAEADASPEPSNEPVTKFKELGERGIVNSGVVRTLTVSMGLENMTEVQSRTISEALKGTDVLAQARTGTGKTIAFLLPIVQNILRDEPSLSERSRRNRFQPSDIKALIISPTRELAEQIAEEARKVTRDTGIVIQTGVGGTQKRLHLNNIQRQGCHILVGTPGRLKDILSDPRSGVTAPGLNTLVLDEADRLLDLGFWPEIQEIQQLLPHPSVKDRQTLMFSATVPREIVKLARTTMKPDLHYVRTVQENEEPTAMRVAQKLVVIPSLEHHLPAVLELCHRELQASDQPSSTRRPFKAIVYFNTTMETDIAGKMFMLLKRLGTKNANTVDLRGTYVYSIHSRLSQEQRTRAADNFRTARSAILMSSDVTSRGMDFPNVTHVIQVGLPQNARDTYIHRIGRTARAGQEGEGWLIVPNFQVREVRSELGDLPMTRDVSLETTLTTFEDNASDEGTMPESATRYFLALKDASVAVDPMKFESTFLAMMGAASKAYDKRDYIQQLNKLARVQWGFTEPPAISASLAQKLGLSRIPELNIGSSPHRDRESSFGSRDSFQSGDRGSSFGNRGSFQSRDRDQAFRPRNSFQSRDREPSSRPRGSYQPSNDRRDARPGNFDRGFQPRRDGDRPQAYGYDRQSRGPPRQNSEFVKLGARKPREDLF